MPSGARPGSETLSALQARFVGRVLLDPQRRLLGIVRDVLVTPREKTPVFVAFERPWSFWRALRSHKRRFAFPVAELQFSPCGALVAPRSDAAIRKDLDFHLEFVAPRHGPLLWLNDFLVEVQDHGRASVPG